ncbi:LacI family transcriptional regulator [Panacibacter ginsenosidivorans]|uniref:LacI family transcriptional regulator n=1 Tax=Panacibacter ginsenosidivorans TaxID=1813871 RepID=A0A5B8VAW0_9BACT|nr:LacI family DNA-binding transcriptional regulator [Panacibacter ginsenosidivorans]QEC68617.1 LacI family transcriptional regulator [Panacibacter ginsenosidivorans]
MSQNTTLKKISQILDISISTVSRALKNHPDISERTKQKVIELAAALEYEPNAYAINLRTNNSKILGLIVPSISYYFYDTFISSIEEECRKNNYTLLILQSGDDTETEISNIKICRHNRVTGVFACITPNTKDISAFLKLAESEIPLIFFDKVPPYENCNKVCIADAAAAKMAADLIIQKHKKNVLSFFGNKSISITQKRLPAFIEAFEQANTSANLDIDFALSFEEAYEKTLFYLNKKNKPDTIFCMSDEILIGVMKAIQQLQLKVPENIAIVALSNGIMPKWYYPEITYIETSGDKLGRLAFARMMECLSGNIQPQELIIGSMLVEGGSI